MVAHQRLAVQRTNALRDQYVDHEFRNILSNTIFCQKNRSHPIFSEYTKPEANLPLMQLMALQRFHLARHYARFIGALYNNCEISYYRKRLAINLYEEETGMLSNTANHEVLMVRFLRALGIGDEERDQSIPLPATTALINYRKGLLSEPASFHMAVASVLIASESQVLEEQVEASHDHLPRIYGFQHDDMSYFSVRASEDIFHVNEGLDLVAEICETPRKKEQAITAIKTTCDLYWKYYDNILEEVEITV